MANLTRSGIGEVVTLERTVAFVKIHLTSLLRLPLLKTQILAKCNIYKECYLRTDLNLSTAKRDGLISKAQLSKKFKRILQQTGKIRKLRNNFSRKNNNLFHTWSEPIQKEDWHEIGVEKVYKQNNTIFFLNS